jgi:hypothetical protein
MTAGPDGFRDPVPNKHAASKTDTTDLAAEIDAAVERFRGHDFVLKCHQREGKWTVAVGNDTDNIVGVGIGDSAREAVISLAPVQPSKPRQRRKRRGPNNG